jgi:hypothetical protein
MLYVSLSLHRTILIHGFDEQTAATQRRVVLLPPLTSVIWGAAVTRVRSVVVQVVSQYIGMERIPHLDLPQILGFKDMVSMDATRKYYFVSGRTTQVGRTMLTRYREGTSGRALTNGVAVTGGSTALSVTLCVSACKNAGYSMAGVEYADECCKFSLVYMGRIF